MFVGHVGNSFFFVVNLHGWKLCGYYAFINSFQVQRMKGKVFNHIIDTLKPVLILRDGFQVLLSQ